MRMKSDVPDWLWPVAIGCICLSPFAPLLAPSDSIVSGEERDYAVMHLPLARFICDELWSGRLPLWNPYLACGQPLPAAQQAMLFYPLATPFCLLLGANAGLKAAIFIHVALYFSGTYLLARRVGISSCSAAYAGLTAAWSGAMLGQIVDGHLGAVFAAALAPWFFLALGGLLRSPTAVASVRLALVGSLCSLAAQPQVFYYTLVAAALWAAGSLVSGTASAHRLRAIRGGGFAAALAMLVAGVQFVPAMELLRDGMAESERGTQDFAGNFSLDGSDSVRLLMPYLNGTPFAGIPQFDRSDHYHERVVYLGAVTPLLAIYGLSRAGASRWQFAGAWGVVLSLAIAFGPSTPAFIWLGNVVPGLLLFRCPGRVFLVASLPVAILAARGLDALARGEPRGNARQLVRLAALLMAGVAIPACAAMQVLRGFEWGLYRHYMSEYLVGELSLWAILLFEAVVVMRMAAVGRFRGLPLVVALSAVTAVDLGHFNVGNLYTEAPEAHNPAPPALGNGKARFIEGLGFESVGSVRLRYSVLTSAALDEHRPTVATYDGGVLPRATARLYKYIVAEARPSLALAACGFVRSSSGSITEHPDGAFPRARFVLSSSGTAELPIEEIGDAEIRRIKRHSVPVELVKDSPCELQAVCDVAAEGWLVVADTHYPGWICRVDGQLRPIEPAHGVFRGVRLDAGRHTVAMSYEPRSLRVGLIATFCGLVIVAAMLLASVITRRRNAGGAFSEDASTFDSRRNGRRGNIVLLDTL